jgi:hypothetical protein
MTLGQTPPLGPLPTAVVMLKFPDSDHEPFGAPLMQHEVFDTFGGWIDRCSYGRAALTRTGIFGWAMMPHPHTYYAALPGANYFQMPSNDNLWYGSPPGALFQDAAAIARSACDYYGQRLVINMFTGWGPTMGMGGGGVIHCSAEHEGSFLDTLAHEGGHALGRLQHAGSVHEAQGPGEIPPNLDDLLEGGYAITRYGDGIDTMGNGTGQYSAAHKLKLGWIDAAKSRTVAEGSVGLADVDGPEPRWWSLEARIPLDDKGHAYSLERRAGVGVVARLLCPPNQMAGAQTVDFDTALLRFGKPLERGVPFVDKYRGVSMTLKADLSGVAFVSVSRL